MTFQWLPTVLLVVGIVLAMLGTVVVAPSAPGDLWRMLVKRTRGPHGTAGGTLHTSGSAQGTGEVHAWIEDADVATKVALLRVDVLKLREQVRNTATELRTEFDGKVNRVDDRVTALAVVVDGLKTETKRHRDQSAILEARGLPLVVLGILISGAPEQLGSNALVGIVTLAVGVAAIAIGAWMLIKHRP